MLRQGTPLDFDNLYEIYMDPSVNPYLNFEIMPKEDFKPIFEELTQDGDLYVYIRHEKIVATCIVHRLKGRSHHVAHVGTFATHPNAHRQGIGTYFMKSLLKILRNQGIKRVELSVEADNLAGEKFYKKLGFELEGRFKNWFKRENDNFYVDELIMAKSLFL